MTPDKVIRLALRGRWWYKVGQSAEVGLKVGIVVSLAGFFGGVPVSLAGLTISLTAFALAVISMRQLRSIAACLEGVKIVVKEE